jgi:indolepyruvate ferredoxin oxidoreductase beta subunit
METINFTIVLTGLGGQGLITLIKIMGQALINKGLNVTTSETHGLSQRGGNVTCFLRYGKKQQAPIPIIGSADLIIATEKSTIMNVLKFCKPDKSTKLVISNYEKEFCGTNYPEEGYILNIVKEHSEEIYYVNVPEKFPSNMVILGKILNFLPLKKVEIEESIKKLFQKNFLETNLEALNRGYLGD